MTWSTHMKNTAFVLLVFLSLQAAAQKERKHDIGLNMAGLFIQNQATIEPSIIYKYKMSDWQLRFQFSINSKFNDNKSGGVFSQPGGFGNFIQDTSFDFDPGKNIQYGTMAGIQRNFKLDGSNFSWFYGIDLIYMHTDTKVSGRGTVILNSSGFSQVSSISLKEQNSLKTFGVGFPLGISFNFGKRFYTAIESKFVIVYQTGKVYRFSETTSEDVFNPIATTFEKSSNTKGFDLGIKPLTGVFVGINF